MPAQHINWLASYPKSGSTWVRAFLEHYTTGKLDINNMNAVIGDERVYYYQAVTAQPVDTFDIYHWALIRPAALNLYLHMNQDKDRMILKTHNCLSLVAGMPVFPELLHGPSVYLLRNPIDVIPSFAKHTGTDIDELIRQMQNNTHGFEGVMEKRSMIGFLSSWQNHVLTWSKHPHTIVIRYEDLKERPEFWFSRVLRQFDLEINKDRLKEAIAAASLENLKSQEEANGFREAGKSEVFFGGTHEKLSPEQIETVTEAFGSVMSEFGYT